jgi:hypothetical protein
MSDMENNNRDDVEFTDEQLRAALKRVGREARRRAFAAGQPVVILKGSALVELYPDGTEKVIKEIVSLSRLADESNTCR